jgi:hypothetical protein
MHNNGSNRLILPQRGPVLSSIAAPQAGIKIEVNAQGVGIVPFVGDNSLPMQLTRDQATGLGVSLISAAALGQHAANSAHETAPEIARPYIIPSDEDHTDAA